MSASGLFQRIKSKRFGLQEVSGQTAAENSTLVKVADLSKVTATLQIKENDDWLTLGPQSTNGLGAYGSVFSVTLSAAAAESVRNALRGQSGWLRLIYTAELKIGTQALVEIEGDIGPAIKALAPPPPPKRGLFNRQEQPEAPTLQTAKEQVEAAIHAGQLNQIIRRDGPIPDEIVRGLQKEVEEIIANQVLEKSLGKNAHWVSTINIRHSKTKNHVESHNIKREADWCSRE